MRNRIAALLIAAVAAGACAEESGILEPRLHVVAPSCSAPAPLLGTPNSRLADHYIVVYKSGTNVRPTTGEFESRFDFTARFYYEHAIQGFAATLSADAIAEIRCDARVQFVEHDAEMSIG